MRNFKSYRNWVNEKFVEDSDPIKDMGIGLNDKTIQSLIEELIKRLKKWDIHIDMDEDVECDEDGQYYGKRTHYISNPNIYDIYAIVFTTGGNHTKKILKYYGQRLTSKMSLDPGWLFVNESNEIIYFKIDDFERMIKYTLSHEYPYIDEKIKDEEKNLMKLKKIKKYIES